MRLMIVGWSCWGKLAQQTAFPKPLGKAELLEGRVAKLDGFANLCQNAGPQDISRDAPQMLGFGCNAFGKDDFVFGG